MKIGTDGLVSTFVVSIIIGSGILLLITMLMCNLIGNPDTVCPVCGSEMPTNVARKNGVCRQCIVDAVRAMKEQKKEKTNE